MGTSRVSSAPVSVLVSGARRAGPMPVGAAAGQERQGRLQLEVAIVELAEEEEPTVDITHQSSRTC
jgi:hypothetical protein